MHGAELGPTRRKPTTLVRWLAVGAALGLAAVAAAAFVTEKVPPVPAQPLANDLATRAPTTAGSAPSLVVAPLAPATAAPEPSASPTPADERPTPKRAQSELAPKTSKPATPAASVSASPEPAPASAASASATASFPAASVTPKVKYTRD
jgi:hypothetical protein